MRRSAALGGSRLPDFRGYVKANLALTMRGDREWEIIEELSLEIEDQYAHAVSEGLSPDDAWELIKSRSPDWAQLARDIGATHKTEAPLLDKAQGALWSRICETTRFALRLPRRSLGFTLAAVLVIALGVGPNTAMFSIIYSVFLAPAPWADNGEVFVIWGRTSRPAGSFRGTVDSLDRSRIHISAREYEQFQTESKAFHRFAASTDTRVTLDGDSARPESIWIQSTTPGFLTMTGTSLQLGRDFLPEEGVEGDDHKVVISHRLWQERFAGDLGIIGTRLRLDGEIYSIVGVTAPGIPESHSKPLWTALAVKSTKLRPGDAILTVIGQLKPGTQFEKAWAEIRAIDSRVGNAQGDADPSWSVRLEPYRNAWLPQRTRANLWLLMVALGFLLLVACVNVANLLLARGIAREKEMAIRVSLGATKWQLFQQTLADTLFLFVSGGLFGAMMGWAILKVFLAVLPPDTIPTDAPITMNVPALLFAGAISLITGLVFGCYPAWRAARVEVDGALKQGGMDRVVGAHRLSRALVMVECAMTISLLAGAGVAFNTLWIRSHVDLGIRTDHILTFELQPSRSLMPKPEQVASFYNALFDKIGALPGVRRVSAMNTWGLLREPGSVPFALRQDPADASKLPRAAIRVASPGFFETFGVRVVSGRAISDADRAGREPVLMVNERFAKTYLAHTDPLTEKVAIPAFPLGKFRIVGVYRDVQNAAQVGQANLPEFCLSFAQVPQLSAIVALRTEGEPQGIVKAVAGAIHSLHSGLPMANVATVDQVFHDRLAFDRFEAALFGTLAAFGLVLAVVGIHGVMAFIVGQRRREIGLRIALGAAPSAIRLAVLKEGVGLAAAGLAIGAAFAWYGGRLMERSLYGTQQLSGGILAVMAGILLVSAALGCGIAARRAASVQPMEALRGE
ncbi:MAG: hypothetical protein JWN34_4095 [Bryobacterales bacterium]|nr:hypothetical protein [Bryobacterales bacterium]